MAINPSQNRVFSRFMEITASPGLYRLVRISIAGIFLYAGITKGMAISDFAVNINAYGMVPPSLTGLVALILVAAELICGTLLVLDKKGGLSGITLMTLLFLFVLGYGISLGLDVDCGCFAPGDPEGEALHNLRQAFVRDLGILAGIAYLYIWRFCNGNPPMADRPRSGQQPL